MLKMNEQFFCLCTKVWLRLLKRDAFDMDLMLRKHTHTTPLQKNATVEHDGQSPRTVGL